jgi:transposase
LTLQNETFAIGGDSKLGPIVLGRKNYLFHGSDAGGERAAAIYGLIGTAKLNRIDELLPWNLAAELPRNPSRAA